MVALQVLSWLSVDRLSIASLTVVLCLVIVEETHRMKKEMFNLRMQLEQTFRKTLQELDAQSQKKANPNHP